MNNKSFDESNITILKEVYEELLLDRENLNGKVEDNNDKIKEIDIYLQSLFDKEDMEYEIFSPRNIQYICREKIQNQNNRKEQLLKQNIEYNDKIIILTNRINKLQNVFINIKNYLYDDSKDVKDDDKEFKYLILDAQQKERQRIARDLHDNTVQSLTHLLHKIELSLKYMDQDTTSARMELLDINQKIKLLIIDMRNIIFYLRPMEFDDIGLKATFERYLNDVQNQTEIQISYHIDELDNKNDLVSISIFHIVKECVNNAIKHSGANKLNIEIESKNSETYICIDDDGIGFDITKTYNNKHFGLLLLKENVSILNGKIDIKSVKNKGTKISINIPIILEGSTK